MIRKSSAELKLQARQALKGNYGTVVGAILIFYVMIMIVSMAVQFFVTFATIGNIALGSAVNSPAVEVGSVVISFLSSLLIMAVEYMIIPGYMKLHLNICTGQHFEIGDLFYVFTHKPHKFLLLALVMWGVSMIFVVPVLLIVLLSVILPMAVTVIIGIVGFIAVYVGMFILMLNLSMVFFIMVDDQEIGVIECLKESCRIMKGNKGRLFYIGLSFIGLCMLSMFSFGLAYLWVAPYMCATSTYFYLDIRGPRKEDVVWGEPAGGPAVSDPGYTDYQNPV